MDIAGAYKGGGHIQHMSPREIEKMKKNMKKAPIIKLKSDIYHKHEEEEAENLLANIDEHQK